MTILLGPPQSSRLFPGQANMQYIGSTGFLPWSIVLPHPSKVNFDQERKAHQRGQVEHVRHSFANSIPAKEYPKSVHDWMQFSASFWYGPPSRNARVDRVLASFVSLFAKRRHPSQVHASEKNAKCVCSLVASHKGPIARVLNHGRRRLGC